MSGSHWDFGAISREAWHRHTKRRELRRRSIPTLHVGPRSSTPSAYYLAPSTNRASGGVRVIYRHVDTLVDLGWNAAVLHATPGFRCSWFENSTRVVDPRTIDLREGDVLVVPEWYGPNLGLVPPGVRTLVFSQGGYLTFDMIDLDPRRPGAPYAEVSDLAGIMTVSEDSADLLRLGFPTLPISIARPVVDRHVFHPAPDGAGRIIGYVPSRRPDELHQLLHLLRAQGVDWELRRIQGLAEHQVAQAMRECSIFLSLSDQDGFGLPPAEAMASGAYVVGYHGGGGREFFDPAYCHPVAGLAEFVRAVVVATKRPSAELAALGAAASAAVLDRYSVEGLRNDLVAIWTPLLGPASAA